jgi:hypothetical protein
MTLATVTPDAAVLELVYGTGSNPVALTGMWVRIPPAAPMGHGIDRPPRRRRRWIAAGVVLSVVGGVAAVRGRLLARHRDQFYDTYGR